MSGKRSSKVQPSYTNQEQNTQLQELPLDVSQIKSSTSDETNPHIDFPPRLTLPFSLYSKRDSEVSRKQANSNGPFKRVRLISDHYVEQHRPPVSASILTEDMGDVDTSVSSIPDDSSLPATRGLISALDTAIMFTVRPQVIELQRPDVFAHTLIEDIAQRSTLTLPTVTRDAGQEDQVDQHKDITATAKGAGLAGFVNLIVVALRYVTNITMTHMVSPAIYGAFSEVSTAVNLLGGLANLGFSGTQTYLLPAYRVKDERGLASGLLRFSTRITLIAGLLLGVLLFAFAPVIARGFYHAPSYELILRELAPLIPLIAVLLVFFSGLQAFKEIKWKVYVEICLPLTTLIALVIFYLLGWSVVELSFSAIAGYICSVLMGWIVLSKIAKRFTGNAAPKYTLRPWFGFALPLLFSDQIFNIANTTDILFLSIFATPAQAGIYIAANRISNLVSMPLAALNVISIPLMTEYYAKGKHEQLESMFKLMTKWSLSLSLPVFLCCLVFGDAILGIFGAQYTTGWLVLVILCFGNLANTGTGAVLQLLSISKRLRVVSIDSITHLILNVGLAFLLVPRFNILGAALASVLVDIVSNGLGVIEVYWIMKLHPYRWDTCKPLLAGGAATLVGILLRHFVRLQPGLGGFAILEQLVLIIPFILVYVLMMMLLRFSEEDRIVFNAVLARFGRQRSTKAV
jgi:O-antigen/teichoic acid export membrane protein